jgi:hypothetical protein
VLVNQRLAELDQALRGVFVSHHWLCRVNVKCFDYFESFTAMPLSIVVSCRIFSGLATAAFQGQEDVID